MYARIDKLPTLELEGAEREPLQIAYYYLLYILMVVTH